MGRHGRALSGRGYSGIGIDRDRNAIAKARALAGGPSYVNRDIRDYRPESSAFDAENHRIFSTNRLGFVTQYIFDALGRAIATIFPDNTSNSTVFDSAGRVAYTIDARGTTNAFLRAPRLPGWWSGTVRMAVILAGPNDFNGRVSRFNAVSRVHRF